MKRIYSKMYMSLIAIALIALQAITFTACNDDMAAENYYTFTGEMMSDYISNRPDMSMMKRIVERADKMRYLASIHVKGTFFPPVNSGIQKFLDREHITRSQTMAFGDGENDMAMLRFAGIGVAMGNGSDLLKRKADYVKIGRASWRERV